MNDSDAFDFGGRIASAVERARARRKPVKRPPPTRPALAWPTEVHRHPPVRATARGFLVLHPASSMRQHEGQHEGQQQKHVLHRCFLRLRQALGLLKSLLLFRRQQKRHRRQQRQQCQQRWRMRGAQLFVGCWGSPKVGVDACSPKSGIKVAGRNGSVGR